MKKKETSRRIPRSVVQRFPKYYALVQKRRVEGVEWVSSQELGDALGLTSSTVRQDLSHLDFWGISKRGYATQGLEKAMADVLGAHDHVGVVIVGAGNLGRALARHGEFAKEGFVIRGLFDNDLRLVGRKVGDVPIRAMADIRDFVHTHNVVLGIIAVPATAAQDVTDRLVLAGIRGILNLAHVHVLAPRTVFVVDARIMASLQELWYAVRAKLDPRRPARGRSAG